MQVRPYRDLNNVIDGAVVTFVDISERKKHEQTRALLAAIVEWSQDAIVSHDLDGTITSWNAGAEQLYGYPSAEAIGQSMTMLLAGALPEDWPDMLARLEQGERIAQFDSARTAKDGRSVEVSVTISPIREGDGRIVGASLVARDISERKAAEQKAALLLGELDHRVKNILAIVSAVVSQTLKTSPTPETFAAEVEGRIKAIASAHSLLTRAGQGEMSLRAIFADRTGALRSRRRQSRHHRPRHRADPEGRAGLGNGGPRAGQQRGQVWRALDTRRPPGGHMEGCGQRRASTR